MAGATGTAGNNLVSLWYNSRPFSCTPLRRLQATRGCYPSVPCGWTWRHGLLRSGNEGVSLTSACFHVALQRSVAAFVKAVGLDIESAHLASHVVLKKCKLICFAVFHHKRLPLSLSHA